MNTTNNGGPAFPLPKSIDCASGRDNRRAINAESGMTLRDYFAAKAMLAIILRPETYEVDTVQGIEATAANAYDFADAMLKARGV